MNITVGKITSNYFNKIYFNKIAIYAKDDSHIHFAKVEQIAIKIDLMKILSFSGDYMDMIAAVELYSPAFPIKESTIETIKEVHKKFSSEKKGFKSVNITWNNGSLAFDDGLYSLNEISGFFSAQDGVNELNILAKGQLNEDILINLTQSEAEALSITAVLGLNSSSCIVSDSKDAVKNIKKILKNYINTKLPTALNEILDVLGRNKYAFSLNGNVHAQIDIKKDKEIDNKIKWDNKIEFNKFSVLSKESVPLAELNGPIYLSEAQIKTEELNVTLLDSLSFVLKGYIKEPIGNAVYNLSMDGINSLPVKNLPQGALSKILSNSKGEIYNSVQLMGTKEKPLLTGLISSKQIDFGALIVNSLYGKYSIDNDHFIVEDLKFETLNGKGSLFGTLTKDNAFGELKIMEMDLSKLKINESENKLFGKIDISADVYGNKLHPKIRGNIKFSELSFGEKIFGTVAGKFDLDSNNIKMTVKNTDNTFAFDTDAVYDNNILKFNEIDINLSATEYIRGIGQINFITEEIDSDFTVENINVESLSFIHPSLKDYKGRISYLGKIKGFIKDPFIIGHVSAKNISKRYVITDEGDVAIEADVVYDRKNLKIPSFSIVNLCAGNIDIIRSPNKQKNIFVEGNIDFNKGNLDSINNLFDGNINLEGIIDGNIKFHYDPSESTELEKEKSLFGNVRDEFKKIFVEKNGDMLSWDVDVCLNIKDMVIPGLNAKDCLVKSSLTKGILKFDKLNFNQDKGSAKLAGEMDLRYNFGRFSFKMEAINFNYYKTLYDGLINISGDFDRVKELSYKGKVYSPDLIIQGINGGGIDCKFNYMNRKFAFTTIRWGSLLKGELELDFSSTARVPLKGKFYSYVKNIELLKPSIPKKIEAKLEGPAEFSIEIGGGLKNPEVKFNFEFIQDKWNELLISSKGKGTIQHGVIRIFDTNVMINYDTIFNLEYQNILSNNQGLNLLISIKQCNCDLLSKGFPALKELKGNFKGILEFTGNMKNIELRGKLSGEGMKYRKLDIEKWQLAFDYSNNQLIIDELSVNLNNGRIFVEQGGIIKQLEKGKFKYNAAANIRDLDLGPITIFGGLESEGIIKTGDELLIEAMARAKNLWINQKNYENNLLKLKLKGDMLEFLDTEISEYNVIGITDFKNYPRIYLRNLAVKKNSQLIANMKGYFDEVGLDIEGNINGIDAQDVFELSKIEVPINGEMTMEYILSGSYNNLQLLSNMNINIGKIYEIPFVNANCQLKMKDHYVTVDTMRIVKQGAFLFDLEGSFPYITESTPSEEIKNKLINIDMELEDFGYSIIRSIFPFIHSGEGILTGKLKIRGDAENPSFIGHLTTQNGTITSKKYFKKLKDLKISVLMEDYTLKVKEISGVIGNGFAVISGKMNLGWLKINNIELKLETTGDSGVSVTIPELSINPTPLFGRITESPSKGRPKCLINLTGSSESPVLAGWIQLENTYFTYPGFKTSADNRILSNILANTLWDLSIRSGENTWFENEYANLKVDGNIHINGKKGNLRVDGRVESNEGSVGYLGTEFDVDKMLFEVIPFEDLENEGNIKNIAYLEGKAHTTVSKYNAQLQRTIEDNISMSIPRANVKEIKPVFVSKNNPDLDSEKALIRATGYDISSLNQEEKDTVLRRGIVQIIDATLTTPIARKIVRNIGIIDTVSVSHEMVDREESKSQDIKKNDMLDTFLGTRYTVGKHFNSKILLEYSVLVDELQNRLDLRHELNLSYNLGRSLYLKGFTELDTRFGYRREQKALIEKQWRFR
ncbi:MAG: translocation/assembly module TamB domain-containing protein [bacterium]